MSTPSPWHLLRVVQEEVKPHHEGIAAAVVVCLGINALARRPKEARVKVDGHELYLYAVAMMFQVMVYPSFAVAAWQSKGFSPDWLAANWTSTAMADNMRHERSFFYSLIGFMAKDVVVFLNSPTFLAHHAVCIVGILLMFAVPAGVGIFILGALTLELGSFTFNVALLFGKDSPKTIPSEVKLFAEVIYGAGMPICNVIGVCQWVYFASLEGIRGTWWAWTTGMMWAVLIIGREQVHLERTVPYFKHLLAKHRTVAAAARAKKGE